MIKHQLAKKFVPTKNFFLQKLFGSMSWGSQAHCCQAADPVTWLKIDPCCRWSIKQTRKFSLPTLNSLVVTTTVNESLELACSLLHGSFFYQQQPTHFDKRGNLLLSFWCWNTHRVSWQDHRFHAWNCSTWASTLNEFSTVQYHLLHEALQNHFTCSSTCIGVAYCMWNRCIFRETLCSHVWPHLPLMHDFMPPLVNSTTGYYNTTGTV